MQDTVPDWITHLAIVNDGQVRTGPRDEMLLFKDQIQNVSAVEESVQVVKQESGEPVVEMKNVSVTYGPRQVGVVPTPMISQILIPAPRSSKTSLVQSAKASATTSRAPTVHLFLFLLAHLH